MERTTLVGVFSDRHQAELCVEELRRAGFRDDQIGFMMQDPTGRGSNTGTATVDRETRDTEDVTAGEGAIAGAVTGGLIGAAGAFFIPAVGPILAGGILATALAGAAIGAATGGIAAALIDLGVPEEEARYYETEFRSGRILVTVKADGRYNEARAIMERFGAHFERGVAATGTMGATTGTGTRMELHEEQLQARKTPAEAGEVEVHKEVVSENRTIDVPVKREEVFVERHPVDRPATDADFKETDEKIRMPVTEEHVTVEKRPVVREELEIGKREVTDTERVSGQVRREEARIERTGDVDVNEGGTLTEEERLRRQRETAERKPEIALTEEERLRRLQEEERRRSA